MIVLIKCMIRKRHFKDFRLFRLDYTAEKMILAIITWILKIIG